MRNGSNAPAKRNRSAKPRGTKGKQCGSANGRQHLDLEDQSLLESQFPFFKATTFHVFQGERHVAKQSIDNGDCPAWMGTWLIQLIIKNGVWGKKIRDLGSILGFWCGYFLEFCNIFVCIVNEQQTWWS